MAWFNAFSAVCNRKLKDVFVGFIQIVYFVVGTIMSVVWLVWQYHTTGQFIQNRSPNQWLMLMILCLVDFVGINLFTYAY